MKKNYMARGQCNICGRYTQMIGADKQDARLLLLHDHGHEFRHCFEGEVKYREVILKD